MKGPRQLTLITSKVLIVRLLAKFGKIQINIRVGNIYHEYVIPDRIVRRLHNWLGWYLARK